MTAKSFSGVNVTNLFFKSSKYLLIGNVYLPPKGSKFSNRNDFDDMEKYFCENISDENAVLEFSG